jgi:hypothetical protein
MTHTMIRRLAPLLLLTPSLLAGQVDTPVKLDNVAFNLHGMYAQPQGVFKDYVNSGWGVGGAARWFPGAQRLFALRGDLGWVVYGRQRVREPFGTSGRITVDITTSNNIFMATGGAELAAPGGPIRPYVNGLYGLSSFWTQSTASGTQVGDPEVFNTTNLRDNIASAAVSGGVRIPLTGQVLLDVGARRWFNGEARYYTRESFGTGATPSVTPTPIQSETDMWTVHVGVSIGR